MRVNKTQGAQIMFEYTPVVKAKAGPYYGTALVGTYSVVIGWNFDDKSLKKGLLGFAIKRTEWDNESGEIIEQRWLGGYKRFKDFDPGHLNDVGSLTAPFQRFRWNDYTLNHKRSYRFEVYPMRGKPGALTREETPLIFEFSPTPEDNGELGVYVNRGVTAAKAYFERFGDVAPKDVDPPYAAYRWLSRGLKESLINFIESAKSGDSLHLAVYEFFDLEIGETLRSAKRRGVKVKIVHDAKVGKKSTRESRHVVEELRIKSIVRERNTVAISHNKLAIHLRNGAPIKAWSGTANLSENGFNFQTNAALVIRDEETVSAYEEYFQNLWKNPSKADCKIFNQALMDRINSSGSTFATKRFFSPIKKQRIIETAVDLIDGAKSLVLISAPFGVHSDMAAALKRNNDHIVEYGLVNSTAKNKVKDLRGRSTQFYPPNKLETYQNDRWDAKAFGAHKIHSKFIVVDPFSDNPRVLYGSANFSKNSCTENDENAILIEGDKRLAAILATEYMRMHDHYKSRYYIRRIAEANAKIRKENRSLKKAGKPLKPMVKLNFHLETSQKWSDTAFKPRAFSHKFADRLAFSGN